MTLGAESLLKTYGSRLAVAEAFLLGQIPHYEEHSVDELVSRTTLEAAKFRVEKLRLKELEASVEATQPPEKTA